MKGVGLNMTHFTLNKENMSGACHFLGHCYVVAMFRVFYNCLIVALFTLMSFNTFV